MLGAGRGQAGVGQQARHVVVQRVAALLDLAHHCAGREHLGDGADAVQGVAARRPLLGRIHEAVSAAPQRPVALLHRHRQRRQLQAALLRGQPGVEQAQRVGVGLGQDGRGQQQAGHSRGSAKEQAGCVHASSLPHAGSWPTATR